ncbi:glycosyltransferase family 39 protein [Thermosulfurimonas sp. F29]|uniref:ArnT family glycosyltransferase n=1 Tax=Thermosulfurimonas sp. F29 TaxID=2867247 RepID=UPI001C82AE50|nr:hypothetical protein [Thermosulfurimonas sp. F29]MBX6422821.1 hypothetical protein [Thermosulfurimonas sp. F29]
MAALEMMERGEYVIPYIEGRPYLLKPPFYNWVLIGFFKTFGSHSEFVARLSSVTAATLTAFFLALIFRAVARPPGLLWVLPGLVFLSTPEVLDKACRAEIDMTYTFLVTVSVFSWFYFHEVRQRPYVAWVLGLGFTALATLTKTFQAVAFFYTPVIPYLLVKKRFRELFSLAHFVGLVIYASIFALWLVPASQRVGVKTILQAWFGEYLAKKNPLDSSGFWGHFLKFPLEYIQGYLPWIVFLPGWSNRKVREVSTSSIKFLALFSFFLVAFSFPFYWFSPGSRLRYILPTAGGFSFLVSIPICVFWQENHSPGFIRLPINVLIALTTLTIPIFAYLSCRKLHLNENFQAIFVLSLFFIVGILFFTAKEFRSWLVKLFVYMLMAKLSFAAVYFTYQDRYRDHYRRASRILLSHLQANETLCDYGVNTPHITYYLRYAFKSRIRLKLVGREELSQCNTVLTRGGINLSGFNPLLHFRARHTPLVLWKRK